MAVNDIYKVASVNFAGNQLGVNVHYFRVEAQAGDTPALGVIAQAIAGTIGPQIKALMSEAASHRGITLNKVYPGFPSVQVTDISEQGFGTVVGDIMSLQTSGIITWKTALAGRAFRGRSYIPFPGESDNSASGHPTNDYVARLTGYSTQLILPVSIVDGGSAIDLRLIVFRRGNPGGSQLVDDARSNQKWATQKSRGDYGKQNPLPF